MLEASAGEKDHIRRTSQHMYWQQFAVFHKHTRAAHDKVLPITSLCGLEWTAVGVLPAVVLALQGGIPRQGRGKTRMRSNLVIYIDEYRPLTTRATSIASRHGQKKKKKNPHSCQKEQINGRVDPWPVVHPAGQRFAGAVDGGGSVSGSYPTINASGMLSSVAWGVGATSSGDCDIRVRFISVAQFRFPRANRSIGSIALLNLFQRPLLVNRNKNEFLQEPPGPRPCWRQSGLHHHRGPIRRD